MLKDGKARIAVDQTIAPSANTATVTGDAVDLVGFDAAAVVFDVGTVANADWTFEIQESDASGSGFAAVAAADLDGDVPDAPTADTVTIVGYLGRKRYLRVVATDGGTGDGSFGVAVVKTAPRRLT